MTSSRPNQGKSKCPAYNMLNSGTINKKSVSRNDQMMELANGQHHYDTISNMDYIRSQIIIRQLLSIAPHCRSRLSFFMIQKKPKTIKIHDITLGKDLGAPVVDVIISSVIIPSFQVHT